MKKGAWKYFREENDINDVMIFLGETLEPFTTIKNEGTPDEHQNFTHKIRIIIDIYED